MHVSAMNNDLLLAVLAVAMSGASQTTAAAGSHCKAEETTLYHCVIEESGKVASLCGFRLGTTGSAPAHLQYRFGLIGQIEFRYPARAGEPGTLSERFYFENQRTADGSTQDYFLWFRNGMWIYEVYYREEFDHCAEHGCTSERTGQAAFVSVWRGTEAWRTGDEAKGRRFKCNNPAGGEDLKSLEGDGLNDPETKARIFRAGDR